MWVTDRQLVANQANTIANWTTRNSSGFGRIGFGDCPDFGNGWKIFFTL
jgi:hypothetical protein